MANHSNLWIAWQTAWGTLKVFGLMAAMAAAYFIMAVAWMQDKRKRWIKRAGPVYSYPVGSTRIISTGSWDSDSPYSQLLAFVRHGDALPLFVITDSDCPDQVRPTVDRAGSYYLKECPQWQDSIRHEVKGYWIKPAEALKFADQL